MSRHPQWESRLSALVAKRMNAPYVPSRHDCLLWPADVAKAVTGTDHARGHRGKYKSTATGYRYLREKLGHDTPESLLDSLFDEKPVGFAGRGDLVLAEDGIPAVCMGAFALSVGQEGNHEGLVRVPREQWIKAWAVGEHHSGELKLSKKRRAPSQKRS
jgi:hypothetical protein